MNQARACVRHARQSTVWFLISVLVLVASAVALTLTSRYRAAEEQQQQQQRQQPAAANEIAASLAQGVAWIWPSSNGPQSKPGAAAPYRQAAVLVESLVLRAHGVQHGGRQQPLPLPAGVALVPVLHIESAPDAPNEFTTTQQQAVLAAVRRQAGTAAAGAGVLQIDFEAPARQREAYRALITAVRAALPTGVRLSITALAHWCTQSDWLDRLPVDEVVPMLYRLGPQADKWRKRFTHGDPNLARRCRGPALGFATNDPPPLALLTQATRPYWFDESAWANPSRPPVHLMP
jgi:hypothetical protein